MGAAVAAMVSAGMSYVLLSGTVPSTSGEGGVSLPSFSDQARNLFRAPEPPPTPAELMIKEAVGLIDRGNLVAARVLLERATSLGSGAAALRLAETYDPMRGTAQGNAPIKTDARLARTWYERALNLGSGAAASRIAALEGR